MSADTESRKRKSGDDVASAAKKVKTTLAKAADRPAPLKSALKKAKGEKVVAEKPSKSKKSKTTADAAPKEPEDSEEVETVISDAEEDGAELTTDQTAALLAGFSSSEDEGSDAEGDDGVAISKLPAAPTTGEVQKTIKKAAKAKAGEEDPENTPGVVYVSRVPHGFFEKQMQAYFSQFGTITHLRLARNKKTGKSKHFAFVEFESSAVADIVAKTMDKYLLFGHILQVRRVPMEQVKEGLWKGGKGVKGGKARPRNRIEGSKLRKGMDREGWEKRIEKEEKRRQEKAHKLKEFDYDFEMPDVKSVSEVAVKPKEIEQAKNAEAGALKDGDESVKLLEGHKEKEAPGVEEKVETVVDGTKIAKKTTKRKSKTGSATTTTTKKRNTKVT